MFSTEHEKMKFSKEEVLADAVYNERVHHTQTPYHPDSIKNIQNELLTIFDENPEIRFTVYLPPYHIFTYCQSEHFGEADALIRQRSEVMRELIQRKNVVLHDFQSDREIVCNGNFYSDVQHFSSKAARLVLSKLRSGIRRIQTENDITANEKELRILLTESMPEYYRQTKPFKD